MLDPDVLTIGFARRVPSYKRLTLMLRDPERLHALLTDPDRPVQLVVAGKAHPADDGGKRLIQQLVHFADAEDVRHRIVFLPDYDISMATTLYPGCDVWLNNPIRPLEASGTSGMKAALNGALNLSILDGWWDEWFDGENGWAIPTADGIEDADRRDDLEAEALYNLIENSVAPGVLHAGRDGLPPRWLAMVKHTLRTLGPKVLASRMLREYVTRLYMPAALSSRVVDADGFAVAKDLAAWKKRVRAEWPAIRIDHVEADGVGDAVMQGTLVTISAFVVAGAADAGGRRGAGRPRTGRRGRPADAAGPRGDGAGGGVRRQPLEVQPADHPRPQRPVRLHGPGPAEPPRARGLRGARPAGRAGSVGRPGGRRPALVLEAASGRTAGSSADAGCAVGRAAGCWAAGARRGDDRRLAAVSAKPRMLRGGRVTTLPAGSSSADSAACPVVVSMSRRYARPYGAPGSVKRTGAAPACRSTRNDWSRMGRPSSSRPWPSPARNMPRVRLSAACHAVSAISWPSGPSHARSLGPPACSGLPSKK